MVEWGAGHMKTHTLYVPFLAILMLSGCANTGTLDSGYAGSLEAWELASIGANLHQRLVSKHPGPIILGTKSRLSQLEVRTLTRFANTLPNGKFVFGGTPTYRIDIKSSETRLTEEVVQTRYSVKLSHVGTKEILGESFHEEQCFKTEAVLSHPKPCRIMRPVILQRALESL